MWLSIGIGMSFVLNEVFTYIVAFNCSYYSRTQTHRIDTVDERNANEIQLKIKNRRAFV